MTKYFQLIAQDTNFYTCAPASRQVQMFEI